MSRRRAWVAAAGMVAGLLLVVAANADVSVIRDMPRLPRGDPADPSRRPTERSAGNDSLPAPLSAAFAVLALAMIAAVVILAGVHFRRLRRSPREWRWRWSDGTRGDEITEEQDDCETVVAEVAADAVEQRASLAGGTPRNAIVACWMRLEASVARAGVARRPADTSTELIERVLTHRSVDPAAIRTLAALYREARFSTHPMGEEARRAAGEALDAVHEGLGVGVSG